MKDKNVELLGSLGNDPNDDEIKCRRIKRIIILIAIILVIAAIVVTLVLVLKGSDKKEEDKPTQDLIPDILMKDSDFIKPISTTKEIQLIELKESKYKFILVHDPKTVNSGLQYRTNFGFCTEVLDGLAHYAEHVFFEGTKSSDELKIFNLVGQFNEFLNAYTWEEETVFQILGSNLTFNETLNTVSEFIQKPLLNETQFTLEVNVVNSEYDTYNYSSEIGLKIIRDNANPEHAFSQTITGHTGNKETLMNITRAKMKEILRNYFLTIFKPENCVFIIYSSTTFDVMANRAQKYFDFKLEEPTKEFNESISEKIKALDNPIFKEGQLGKIAVYNNLRQIPLLILNFVFSEKENYAEIYNLLYYLLYHYNEGSFLNYLKMKNYVSKFDHDVIGYYKNCEFISLYIYLTSEGLKNIDKIIEAFFASVNAIKNETDENLEKIIDNIKNIENKKYQFKEDKKTEFPDDINTLVSNFYYFGAKNILGSPVYELFTLKRVKQVLEELSPDKTFITLDTNETITSQYLNLSSEIKYTRSHNVPYKMNNLSDELISKLKQTKSIDEYEFKIRKINEDYSKLENMTDFPCFKKEPNTCDEYNETNPNSQTKNDPYILNKTDNLISLMQMDRTFGIPFIKGYIEIELNDNIKDYISTEEQKAIVYLIKSALNHKFEESSLYEAGSTVEFDYSDSSPYKITITISTYNDLLNKVIDFIINLLKEPLEEVDFINSKERYYQSISTDISSPTVDLRNEMLNIFKRFISVDTFSLVDVPRNLIEEASYTDFKDIFNKIIKNFKKIKYLTYGDISYELASETTNKLNTMINTQKLLFKFSSVKTPIIPYNSSIYYIMKSQNIYQVQGRTMVLYEFDESLKKKMDIFSYCAYDVIFDYIRTKRGSGYSVKTFTQKIINKSYLIIYTIGKVYSPEKMDRLINEALEESFKYKNCQVDLIVKHLKTRDNINGYIEDKFEDLISYIDSENNFRSENYDENDENMTYESIVNDIKDVFVNKVRRIAILNHRGDESDDLYNQEANELDKVYYFDNNITSDSTQNIYYLNKFIK